MSSTVGFLAAITSMLLWGSYFVPMKRIKSFDPFYFQLIMCIAIFISSVVLSLLYRSFVVSVFGIVSGFLWAVGNAISGFAIKKAALSTTFPIWCGTGVFVSVGWGLLFFHEPIKFLFLTLIGIILLVIGVWKITQEDKTNNASSKHGVIAALVAGILFGSYLVPLKLSHLSPIPFLFPMSIGILLGGTIVFLLTRPRVTTDIIFPGALSGIMWNIANFASFFAILGLGITVGFPLTQMALFVSVLWGVIYFKEIKGRKNIMRVITSAVILFAGSLLLSFSHQ